MFYYQNRGYEKPNIVADRGGSNVGGGWGAQAPLPSGTPWSPLSPPYKFEEEKEGKRRLEEEEEQDSPWGSILCSPLVAEQSEQGNQSCHTNDSQLYLIIGTQVA